MSNAALPMNAAAATALQEPDPSAASVDTETQRTVLEYQPASEDRIEVGAADGTLKQRTIRSSLFTLAGFGSSQVIRFGRTLILTRLLYPEAFGLTAIVGMFIGMLQQFSDIGLGPAIIQGKRGDERRFLDTAWTLSIVRGVILFLGLAIIAWPVSLIYKEARLMPLLAVAGFNAILNGFNSTSLLSLSRHLKLGRLTLMNVGGEVLTTVVIVALAWKTHNVWSIICGGLVTSGATLIVSHFLIPGYRNRFAWDKEATRELFHFGKWIFVSTAVAYFANESDRLILGKMVPMALLGFYSQAAGLVRMPWEVISRLAGNSLFPALARFSQGPRKDFADKVRLARSVILPMGAAAVIGLAMGAPLLVGALYDFRYLPVGWMAQLMAVGLWVTILQSSADRALLALGHARPLAITNSVNACLTVVFAFVGNYVGHHFVQANGDTYALQGFILGVAVGNVGGHVVIQTALRRCGINILVQDLKYTLVVLAIAVVGLGVPKRVIPMLHPHHAKLVSYAWGAMIIGIVCAWSGLRALKWMKR
jgi:O-antigen/teichoic acid export membrane protein